MVTKPNLYLLPTAYKANKVYSVLPADGVGDFDFSRATTATRINKDGLIETVGSNIPRLNYPMIDGVVSGCPSLLLEPQRTNYFQQSNQFDTTWIVSLAGISVTPNQVGVGGSTDAWKLTEGTFNGNHFIRQTPNIGGVVSISVYAKAGTNDFLYIRGVNSGLDRKTWFNLSNGTVGTSQGISAEMISMGDGWYRCVMVLDHQTAFEYYIGTSNADGVSSYQGNNNYIFIQNAQLEQGSYATSYIPTQGSAVTRVAETCNNAGDVNTFNDSEGVLFAEIKSIANTGASGSVYLGDGTTSNRIQIVLNNDGLILGFITGVNGGIPLIMYSNVKNYDSFHKIALTYSPTNTSFWIDGFKIDSDNGNFSFNNGELNTLDFKVASEIIYGNTKQLQYFDTALTDTDLEELTSWRSFNEMARDLLYTIQ